MINANVEKSAAIVSYPTGGLDHLELQRVSEGLPLQQRHGVTAGQA